VIHNYVLVYLKHLLLIVHNCYKSQLLLTMWTLSVFLCN